jgi:ankyrin repeat protein
MTPEWEAAARGGSVAILGDLLSKGTDVNGRNRHGQTAVMIAATEGHASAVRLLAEHGADLNHTAKYGLSALMIAVVRGHVDVVRALTSAGADRAIKGTGAPGFAGKTALDLAEGRGDSAIIEILRATA